MARLEQLQEVGRNKRNKQFHFLQKQKPLFCFEYKKLNKRNVYDINFFKSLKIIVDTDWYQEWNIKTSFS